MNIGSRGAVAVAIVNYAPCGRRSDWCVYMADAQIIITELFKYFLFLPLPQDVSVLSSV